jgi:hypothetical protein
VLGDLGVQELDTAGQGTQAGHGGRGLDIPVAQLTQPCAGADQTRSSQPAQASAEGLGSGDDQRVALALVSVAAWTAERRAVSRTDNAAR